MEDDIKKETEVPVVEVIDEVAEKLDFQFPSDMFPVNPNYKSDREINDKGFNEELQIMI